MNLVPLLSFVQNHDHQLKARASEAVCPVYRIVLSHVQAHLRLPQTPQPFGLDRDLGIGLVADRLMVRVPVGGTGVGPKRTGSDTTERGGRHRRVPRHASPLPSPPRVSWGHLKEPPSIGPAGRIRETVLESEPQLSPEKETRTHRPTENCQGHEATSASRNAT